MEFITLNISKTEYGFIIFFIEKDGSNGSLKVKSIHEALEWAAKRNKSPDKSLLINRDDI